MDTYLEILKSLPNVTCEKGKKNYCYPSVDISFHLEENQDHLALIESKQKIAREHNIKGVGYAYTNKVVIVGVPLYGSDTDNCSENIIKAYCQGYCA